MLNKRQVLYRFIPIRGFFGGIAVCLLAVIWSGFCEAQEIYLGMPQEELENELGSPSARITKGKKEYFYYGEGMSIEITKGKVTNVKGLDFLMEKPEAPPPSTNPAAKPDSTSTESAAENKQPPTNDASSDDPDLPIESDGVGYNGYEYEYEEEPEKISLCGSA